MTADDPTEIRDEIRRDPLCSTLGIEFERIEPGYAETAVTATRDLLNGNGTLHGAVIFALADSAAGAAGQASGETTVGIETNTSFLTAVERGERVIATAEVTHESTRFNETQVTVTKVDGTPVGTFRARGYRLE